MSEVPSYWCELDFAARSVLQRFLIALVFRWESSCFQSFYLTGSRRCSLCFTQWLLVILLHLYLTNFWSAIKLLLCIWNGCLCSQVFFCQRPSLHLSLNFSIHTWGFSLKRFTPSAGSNYEMEARKNIVLIRNSRDCLHIIFFALDYFQNVKLNVSLTLSNSGYKTAKESKRYFIFFWRTIWNSETSSDLIIKKSGMQICSI